jgi:sulfotransferase family protein
VSKEPLVHIGLQKTGSTWLQNRLFNTAEYGFASLPRRIVIDDAFLGGNPFTFDAGRARSLIAPVFEEAAQADVVPVISHELLAGQPLADGIDARLLADRIRETMPDARILIVIREQRSMLLSTYKQYVKASGTKRVEDLWRDRSARERRRPGPGLDWLAYHHLIAYHRSVFGPDRVLVLPFELLTRDASAFAAEICKFAGNPYPTDVPKIRDNPPLPALLVGALRRTNIIVRTPGLSDGDGGELRNPRLRRMRLQMVRRIGPKIPNALSGRAEARLRSAIDGIVAGRFGASNRATAELTGLDLAGSGYEVS